MWTTTEVIIVAIMWAWIGMVLVRALADGINDKRIYSSSFITDTITATLWPAVSWLYIYKMIRVWIKDNKTK